MAPQSITQESSPPNSHGSSTTSTLTNLHEKQQNPSVQRRRKRLPGENPHKYPNNHQNSKEHNHHNYNTNTYTNNNNNDINNNFSNNKHSLRSIHHKSHHYPPLPLPQPQKLQQHQNDYSSDGGSYENLNYQQYPESSPNGHHLEMGDISQIGGENPTGFKGLENVDASLDTPLSNNGPVVIVRGEEVGIVVVVLLLWVGAIILFFNRWGKIRMLEPYQPKFCEAHRVSCGVVDPLTHCTRTYSKFNLSSDMLSGSPHFTKCNYHGLQRSSGAGLGTEGGLGYCGSSQGLMGIGRPRQNSVFVTSPNNGMMALNGGLKGPSRKTKSAIDLSSLVLSEEFIENDEDADDSDEEKGEKLDRVTQMVTVTKEIR